MDQLRRFFSALFDFSFKAFITSKLVPVLYGLSVACAALIALGMIKSAFSFGASAGILTLLIVAPLFFLISIIWARVILEIIMVLFRISKDTDKIAESIEMNKHLEELKKELKTLKEAKEPGE